MKVGVPFAFLLAAMLVVAAATGETLHGGTPPLLPEQRLERVEKLLSQQDGRLRLLEAEKRQLQDDVELLRARAKELASKNQELEDKVSQLMAENAASKDNSHSSKTILVKKTQRAESVRDTTQVFHESVPKVEAAQVTDERLIDVSTKTSDVNKQLRDMHAPSRDVYTRSDDIPALEPMVTQLAQRVTEVTAELQALKNAQSQQGTAIQEAGNSVYVRWGASACPNTTSSHLVYSGVIGGAWYNHAGAATNYLCLTMQPVFSDHAVPAYHANLYGGEYETLDERYQQDPVCAVCRTQHASTIMVPGTNVCPVGWTTEYSGFLMAGYYAQAGGSEFICVDSARESRYAGVTDENGSLLYYTITQCGSVCPVSRTSTTKW